MKRFEINNFEEFISYVSDVPNLIKSNSDKGNIVLYRGQTSSCLLIPSVARLNSREKNINLEKEMLSELKRRTQTRSLNNLKNEWDWLVLAQHYGLKTRLLDWTSNPLCALWFACSNYKTSTSSPSYVYVFVVKKSYLLDKEKYKSPFRIPSTKVFRPPLNNDRILAQAGWFTAHKYSDNDNKFVPLEKNKRTKENIVLLEINPSVKKRMIGILDSFGVNYQTLFPDLTGICSQINWENEERF